MPIKPEHLDELLAGYEKPEDLLGEDGLFKQLKKALLERALGAELTQRQCSNLLPACSKHSLSHSHKPSKALKSFPSTLDNLRNFKTFPMALPC